jgi:hypothetical protein
LSRLPACSEVGKDAVPSQIDTKRVDVVLRDSLPEFESLVVVMVVVPRIGHHCRCSADCCVIMPALIGNEAHYVDQAMLGSPTSANILIVLRLLSCEMSPGLGWKVRRCPQLGAGKIMAHVSN